MASVPTTFLSCSLEGILKSPCCQIQWHFLGVGAHLALITFIEVCSILSFFEFMHSWSSPISDYLLSSSSWILKIQHFFKSLLESLLSPLSFLPWQHHNFSLNLELIVSWRSHSQISVLSYGHTSRLEACISSSLPNTSVPLAHQLIKECQLAVLVFQIYINGINEYPFSSPSMKP